MWDLIVSVPDHCLSFYFESNNSQSRRRIIVYLGNRKQSAIFGIKGERGYISAFFHLPNKDFFFIVNLRNIDFCF